MSAKQPVQLRLERKTLKAKHKEFFDKVSALMFEHDPVGLNFKENLDEYDSEAGSVIPRVQSCKNASELCDVLHEEFCRYFNDETAGPKSNYQALAHAIWSLAIASDWPTSQGAASHLQSDRS